MPSIKRHEAQLTSGLSTSPIRDVNRSCGSSRARCIKRSSRVSHGHSPLCVGPCVPHRFLKPVMRYRMTGTPSLPPHYRTSTLLRLPPTSDRETLFLAFYTCPRVRRSLHATAGSPWLPLTRSVRLDTASDPGGEYPHRSPSRGTGCSLPAGQCRRHSPIENFGAQHLQGRFHPLPLHLACFCAYASIGLLPLGQ